MHGMLIESGRHSGYVWLWGRTERDIQVGDIEKVVEHIFCVNIVANVFFLVEPFLGQ